MLDPRAAGGPAFNDDSEENIGLDAKFVFQDSLVLDATLNPDFSQVESDEPQVTVNERFEVRFDERRPFFLENADFFNTESALVFTRCIVDPSAGLRLTGKQGPWSFGTLLTNDEAPGQRLDADHPLAGEAADIRILRAFRDVAEQGRMGMLYTERKFGAEINRVSSLDARFKLNPNWTTELQLIGTRFEDNAGRMRQGRQYNARVDRSGLNFAAHAHVIDTTDGYRADLGFAARNYQPDTRSTHGFVTYTFWPEDRALNNWMGRLYANQIVDQSSLRLYTQLSPSLGWSWDGRTELNIAYDGIRERLRPRDILGLGTSRDYARGRWTTAFSTQMFAAVGFNVVLRRGETINLAPAGFSPIAFCGRDGTTSSPGNSRYGSLPSMRKPNRAR